MDLDKLLKLVAVMGKEAFTEWRSRSPSHRPEEGTDNMLVLLDAVGEDEFRQMAHQKYLGDTTTALELHNQSAKKAIACKRSGVERRAARQTAVQSFQHCPIERLVKREEAADSEGDPMPQPRACMTKPHWSDAERTALSNWLSEKDRREQAAGKPMGAPSMAARAKEELAEMLGSRSVFSIARVIRQIRAARIDSDNRCAEAAMEVVGVVALRKQPERAKKNVDGSGGLLLLPSSQHPSTHNHLFNNADPWSTEESLALTNWFDTINEEPIALTHLAARAQTELADVLPSRSLRAIESKLLKLRRGQIVKQSAKISLVEKAQWSLVQKALLVRWIEQNVAGKMAMNSMTCIPLAQRAKEDLGDEFHDRSVMAVANAIMKVKSFDTAAKRDEWVKKDGL